MNVQEQLLESAKATSKLCTTALVAIAALTLYLLQRAMGALFGSVDAYSSMTQSRIDGIPGFGGFEFSFATLSIIWPLVLAILCLALSRAVDKLVRVSEQLSIAWTDPTPDQLSAISPVWFTPATSPTGWAEASWWRLAKWVPCAVLLLHPLAIAWSAFEIHAFFKKNAIPSYFDHSFRSRPFSGFRPDTNSEPEPTPPPKLNYPKLTLRVVYTVIAMGAVALAWPLVRGLPKTLSKYGAHFGGHSPPQMQK
jgi:hypothetical protein